MDYFPYLPDRNFDLESTLAVVLDIRDHHNLDIRNVLILDLDILDLDNLVPRNLDPDILVPVLDILALGPGKVVLDPDTVVLADFVPT